MSHEVTPQRQVNASQEKVWTALTDLDTSTQYMRGIKTIERLAGEGFGVDVGWRETRTMMGKTAAEDMYVTAANGPHSVVVETDNDGVHYYTKFTLTPVAGGTLLQMKFSGVPIGSKKSHRLMWALFGKIGLNFAAKEMQNDLEDIARHAESL